MAIAETPPILPPSDTSEQLNFIIEANSNRTFSNILYRADQSEFDETTVVIKFSTGEFMRVPFAVYTQSQLVQTSPAIVDFGVVQLNQKPLKMKVSVRFDPQKVKKVLDYFLPLDQPTLDFDILPVTDLAKSQEIGTVYLNPTRAQFIATSIKVKLETFEEMNDADLLGECDSESKTMFVEIPIIGSIVNHTDLFAHPYSYAEELQLKSATQPAPLLHFNLNQGVPGDLPKGPGISYQMKTITSPLYVRNNLASALVVRKILDSSVQAWQHDSEFQNQLGRHFSPNPETLALLKQGRQQVTPGQSVQYRTMQISSELPFRQGYQLLWLKVNQVLVPAQVTLAASHLYCQFVNETVGHSQNGDVFLC